MAIDLVLDVEDPFVRLHLDERFDRASVPFELARHVSRVLDLGGVTPHALELISFACVACGVLAQAHCTALFAGGDGEVLLGVLIEDPDLAFRDAADHQRVHDRFDSQAGVLPPHVADVVIEVDGPQPVAHGVDELL